MYFASTRTCVRDLGIEHSFYFSFVKCYYAEDGETMNRLIEIRT